MGCISLRDDFDDSLTEELMLRTLSDCAQILPALEEAKLVEHRGDLLALHGFGAVPEAHARAPPAMGERLPRDPLRGDTGST